MLLVKLTAEDLRTVDRARTPQEIDGVVTLLREAIKSAEYLHSIGKEPELRQDKFNWQQAIKVLEEVLGKGNVLRPPFPDSAWFSRIRSVIQGYGLDEKRVREIGEYAKAHLKLPVQMAFLILQHERILAGTWNMKNGGVPDLTLHKLPEE